MKLSLELPLKLSLKKYQRSCLWNFLWNWVSSILCWFAQDIAPWRSQPTPQPPLESRRRCCLDVGTRLADRERSWSLPRSRPRRRSVGTTAPGVWRWTVAWVRPPVERRPPSAHRRGAAMVRRVPPLSERHHRPRSSSPTPSATPGPRPQPRNSFRLPALLADLVTIYHYIYRLVLLTSQPERVFIQPARIAAGGIFHLFTSTH